MKTLYTYTFILSILFTAAMGFSCKNQRIDTELETLREAYNSARNQHNNTMDVDSLKYSSVLLAEAYLDRLDKVDDPQAAEFLYKAARLYEPSYVNPLRALELFEQFAATYPNHPRIPDVTFTIGYIYNNYLRDFTQARYAYERFLKSHPDHELTPSVYSEIEQLDLSTQEPSEPISAPSYPEVEEAGVPSAQGD